MFNQAPCPQSSFYRENLSYIVIKEQDKNRKLVNIINKIKDINIKRANLLNCWDEEVEIKFGEPTEIAGKYAFKSLTEVTEI